MGKESKKSRDGESKKSKKSSSSKSATDSSDLAAAPVKHLFVSPIASPIANADLTKKTLRTIKKATAIKACRRGTKEVVKALRKGEKGIVVLAADVTPMDVISHIPVLCEDNDVPYVFVPSKFEIGTAGSTKRPASVMLICLSKVEGESKEAYETIHKAISALEFVK